MKYVFIQTHAFKREAANIGLTLDDFRDIENAISDGPQRWPVIPGASGLRKMRFAPAHRAGGKRGGVRVCYFPADRHAIKAFIDRIKASYK